MLIRELTPRHIYQKELDYAEMQMRLTIGDMETHISDKTNPHDVTSDQVEVLGGSGTTVYQHIVDTDVHRIQGAIENVIKTGAEVVALLGKVVITTDKGTIREMVFVNGLLKAEDTGTEYDYSVVHNLNWPPGPSTTDITFHDYNDILHTDSVVRVVYERLI